MPVIPGSEKATDTAADAMAFAESAGFPVILKAAMGGGGRGMRVVRRSKAYLAGPVLINRSKLILSKKD